MNESERFPTGKNRREEVDVRKEGREDFKKHGRDRILLGRHYSWTNSPLDGKSNVGEGEPIASTFRHLIPETYKRSLRQYIESILEFKEGQAVGVEFGGVGTGMFSDFTPGFFKKSVAVSLVDHRHPNQGEYFEKTNKALNLTFVEGDIFEQSTYDRLNEELGSQKVDLIIERMAGGLEHVPIDPNIVTRTLERWYELLDGGGVMFVEVPWAFRKLLAEWAFKINDTYPGKIEIDYTDGGAPSIISVVFKLIKLPGAPDKLPILTQKELRKISQE